MRKKHKRSSTVADGIDALFDSAIGREIMQSTLEPDPVPVLVKSETTKGNLALI